ncbi:uncharacterized protein [Saccopteryx bilineata]|uniref:uncharacterized protein n=1 Tax=Saccopteryx bilineata TaxID=59482 RepID=UPI00338DB4EF
MMKPAAKETNRKEKVMVWKQSPRSRTDTGVGELPEAQRDTFPRQGGGCLCGDYAAQPPPRAPPPPSRSPAATGCTGRGGGGRRVGPKEEMGQGADGQAAAAGAGPPLRRSEREGEPFPPLLPPPREAAPTFLRAQDAAWATRDSETLSALPPPACNPHLAPTAARAHPPLRSAAVYLRPRSRQLLRRGPNAGPWVPVTPPPSSPTWTPPSALSVPGAAGAPALPAGSGGGGREGSGPGLRCSARLAPPLLPLPPPCLASSLPSRPLSPSFPPFSRAATSQHAPVTTAAARRAALFSTPCSGPACTDAELDGDAGGR